MLDDDTYMTCYGVKYGVNIIICVITIYRHRTYKNPFFLTALIISSCKTFLAGVGRAEHDS